jgi:membrane protein YqaA with SNARE-associated domain
MDWQNIVKTVAPWIGTALGGPLGGMAVEAAANALGISEKTTDAVKAAIAGATPEQMLALKQADQQFARDMQALGFSHVEKLAELANNNTKDARAMQVSTRSRVPAILAVLITVGFFGILIGMMAGLLKSSENQALLIMLGALGAAWGAVVNYYFGSSADSGRKTELLAQSPAIK